MPVPDFVIRPLDRTDAAEYRLLRLDALELYPASFATSRAEWARISLKEIEDILSPPGGSVVLGAFHQERSLGNVLIGIAGLQRNTREKYRHKAMVWGMYVDPEWRGQGIARSLLERLIGYARAQGELRQVILTVTEGNAAAQALYEQLGFRVYGVEPNAIDPGDGSYRNEIFMVLDLRGT
ncbi:N-acetyltransferase family protein [Acidisoma sp. 7E03]